MEMKAAFNKVRNATVGNTTGVLATVGVLSSAFLAATMNGQAGIAALAGTALVVAGAGIALGAEKMFKS